MRQGYTELLDLLLAHKEAHNTNLPVDVFGTGEDLEDIKERADERHLAVSFLGARDHLDDAIHPYRCICCYDNLCIWTASLAAVSSCCLMRETDQWSTCANTRGIALGHGIVLAMRSRRVFVLQSD